MPYEVIALDRDTALESAAKIKQIVLTADVGELEGWPRVPIQISDIDQLSDVLDSWGISHKPDPLHVEEARRSSGSAKIAFPFHQQQGLREYILIEALSRS